MFKYALLAATVLFTASAAHAISVSPIDIMLGSPDTYSSGGTFTPTIDLTNFTTPISLSNAAVLSGNLSIPNYATAPTGMLYGDKYLAVLGGGTGTFSLAPNTSTFSLTWGSIDSYNELILTDSNKQTYVITGTDILNYLGNPTGVAQANVIISDPTGSIISAELTGTTNSFEAANFGSTAVAAVPLPASAVLFSMALAGLGLIAWRKRSAI